MSRIKNLKELYPEYDLSLFDLFENLDCTPSKKYLPLICKIFDDKFCNPEPNAEADMHRSFELLEVKKKLTSIGFDSHFLNNLSDNQLIIFKYLSNIFSEESFRLIEKFIDYNERGLIKKNDILSYKNINEVRENVGLAEFKSISKELEKQVIKEYEDDIWLAVRPLTFESSIKYGSSTKWCTTYKEEKNYFSRYWRKGILVYFINKINGLKYAVFKDFTENNDISWWNAADKRKDFTDLEIDDYMLSIIKKILMSTSSNMDLCDAELKQKVLEECEYQFTKSIRMDIAIPENAIQSTYLERESERVYENDLPEPVVETTLMRG